MNDGLILLATLKLPVGGYGLFLSKNKRTKRHVETFKTDWIEFEIAITDEDFTRIEKYGTQLIWNDNLTNTKLDLISEKLDSLFDENAELEKLKNLIFNKKLHWNRAYFKPI